MPRSYRFALTALLIALCANVFVGCDSAEEEAIDELTGDWVSDDVSGIFLRITESRIIIAAETTAGDFCDTFEIVNYDPDTNTMTVRDSDDDDTDSFIARRDGDDLIIDGDRFERTNDFPDDCP